MEWLTDLFVACDEWGVNLPALIGFSVAAALAYKPGNPIVSRELTRKIHGLVRVHGSMTVAEVETAKKALQAEFDLPLAATIGFLERVLYIYSVMFGAWTVLGGWLVMKAFFNWLKKPAVREMEIPVYHVYLYGNALSLLLGLAAGAIGQVIALDIQKLIIG